jgi:hypothetical protein
LKGRNIIKGMFEVKRNKFVPVLIFGIWYTKVRSVNIISKV